jgi:hypothetical protein
LGQDNRKVIVYIREKAIKLYDECKADEQEKKNEIPDNRFSVDWSLGIDCLPFLHSRGPGPGETH